MTTLETLEMALEYIEANADSKDEWDMVAALRQHIALEKQPAALAIPDLQDRLVAVSAAIADQDDRAAQAILGETLRILAAAPEQPADEPVAVILEDMKGGGYIEWLDDTYFVSGTKFYTRPQTAAHWVGLTDEQRRAEFAKLYPADEALLNLAENNRDFMVEAIGARHHWHAFQLRSKATEAKLKEKNT